MIKNLLLLNVLLLLGCESTTRPPVIPVSEKSAEIEAQYRDIDSLLHGPVDSLENHVKRMQRTSKGADATHKAMVEVGFGILYLNKSANQLAMKHYEHALDLLRHSAADTLKARTYTGLGAIKKLTGDFPEASSYFFKALNIYEHRKNEVGIAVANNHLAEIYQLKRDFILAKDHLQIAMRALNKQKSHFAYIDSAHSLANIYGMAGDYSSAMKLDEEGIRIADSINSPKLKSPFYDNKANCFLYSNQLDSAQFYFNKCLEIDRMTQNPKQIADTYSNLGQLAAFRKDFPKAEQHLKKSIEILQQIDSKPNLLKSYEILSETYRDAGKPLLALDARNTYLDIYQKLMNEKKEAALAEYKVVYETEKKEKIIAQNKVELLLRQREVKQRTHLLFGISLFTFFIAITGWLIYRQQKLKNRQQQQEHELKTAIAHIETQNKLQQQRLAISRDLHDNIGAQLTFIISSVDNIKYAFDLKDTQLETRLQTINNFTQATIIELRDTIWAMNNDAIAFEDLRTRIYNFIEKAKNAKHEVAFKFEIDSELDQIKLSSVNGMNIYRTIQEAVNNAIKYASATLVAVRITSDAILINITISDNGSGFSPETVANGNGIANMQKRIAECGGSFAITSNNDGTTVAISLQKAVIEHKAAM